MRVSLIIPAYNESEGVDKTAASVQQVVTFLREKHEVEIVFVNDGSKDDTEARLQAAFASDSDVQVVSHDRNRGLGAAIRTGFAHATGDVIITTDFDGTYSFSTIPQLLAKLLAENVDIVTASPYHPKGKVEGVPRYRLLFSYGASFLYRVLVRWDIYCWTALFRAYKRPVIDTVTFESDDFLAGTELLVKAIRAGYKVAEFPTTLHVRTFGQSSIRIARVTKAHLKFQARLLWSSLTGRPVNSHEPLAQGQP